MKLARNMRAMRNRGNLYKENSTYVDSSTAFSLLKQGNVKFLDVRANNQQNQEKIPTAKNALEILNFRNIYEKHGINYLKSYYKDFFQNQLQINANDHIIAYENSLKSQWGPHLTYFILNYLGFKKIQILDGGIESWKSRNYLTDKQQQNSPQIQQQIQFIQQLDPIYEDYEDLQTNEQYIASQQQVKQTLKKMDKIIIDVREGYEFKTGRIPSAINIPLSKIFTQKQNGLFLQKEQHIDNILSENNIDKSDNLIVYSQRGNRSTQFQAALQNYGFSRIQNYAGAFSEWRQYVDNKVEH